MRARVIIVHRFKDHTMYSELPLLLWPSQIAYAVGRVESEVLVCETHEDRKDNEDL